MTYKTILVHLDANGDNEGVLGIAGQLAGMFSAKVIGIAAAQPVQALYSEGFVMAEVETEERQELNRELEVCRAQFREAMAGRVPVSEWRSEVTLGSLADYVADNARCADLIITGKDIGASLLDESRRVNIGDLVLKAGRPVLIVPQGVTRLAMKHVFIGWKDTREARRAVADALPLLEAAGNATVLEITTDKGMTVANHRVKDVATWLEHHGIAASAQAIETSSLQSGYLHATLLDRKCDLLVAGAYGHSRLGEWMFGGVTSDVLLDPDFCVLVSH